MSEDKIAYGNPVVKNKACVPIEVDCSTWADMSTGGWAFGSFLTKRKTRSVEQPDQHLSFKAVFAFGSVLETIETTTAAMIEHLSGAASEFNLVFDPVQSGLNDNAHGATVAVLTFIPQALSVDLEDCRRQLLEKLRGFVTGLSVVVELS